MHQQQRGLPGLCLSSTQRQAMKSRDVKGSSKSGRQQQESGPLSCEGPLEPKPTLSLGWDQKPRSEWGQSIA